MSVLLTGGMGYIGSHAAVALSQLGYKIVLYDNLSNSNDALLKKLTQITGQEIPFVKGDVRDTDLVSDTLSIHGIKAVIHFAGLKAVGESIYNPIDYYGNNVQGTISLLNAMKLQQVKTFVFSSSATVYGEPQFLPLNESHPTSATNPYGRSKLHVEEMLKDLSISSSDWRIVCLRYFNPIGAHMSGQIGEKPNGVINNLMPLVAQVADGQRGELKIFGGDYPTADGTCIRDYIHVMDIADGHVAALDFLSNATGWHAINLGTGKGYSVLDMIRAFEKASGHKVPYKVIGRRAGDVAQCYADPSKASELLNWTAKRTLEEMCNSIWQFQKFLG